MAARGAINRRSAMVVTVGSGVLLLASACSAILGDTSYRCASQDDGACPNGMVCAVSTGVCVDEEGADDGGPGDDAPDVTFPDVTTRGDDGPGADSSDGDSATTSDARADAPDGEGGPSSFATPPVCDGVIGAGEYGSTVNGTNQLQTTTGQTWYATWDATNLYLAVSGVALGDGVVAYVDALAGGALDAGEETGFSNYDGVTIDPLPFPAQLVLYAKAGGAGQAYTEFRTYDETAGWSVQENSAPQVCGTDTNTNAREIVLPWSTLGAARPASFRFFAFATESPATPGPFAQIPATNPAATTSAWIHAFDVADTSPGGSAPFASPY
jgi:hypothetical protein